MPAASCRLSCFVQMVGTTRIWSRVFTNNDAAQPPNYWRDADVWAQSYTVAIDASGSLYHEETMVAETNQNYNNPSFQRTGSGTLPGLPSVKDGIGVYDGHLCFIMGAGRGIRCLQMFQQGPGGNVTFSGQYGYPTYEPLAVAVQRVPPQWQMRWLPSSVTGSNYLRVRPPAAHASASRRSASRCVIFASLCLCLAYRSYLAPTLRCAPIVGTWRLSATRR